MLDAAESKPTSLQKMHIDVCPVSILSNWTDQISQFVAPGILSVELYHGFDQASILPKEEAELGTKEMCEDTWRWQSLNPMGYREEVELVSEN